ncbi:MAG: 30S ribosomal protein S12 methylthiotransferase RimO [Proteobacteria bacterium]|nr:30S ribosomal protein S12 methylthiotransferase RimO [Pseudomonadota bacterium]
MPSTLRIEAPAFQHSQKNMHLITLGCARNRVDAEVMLGSMVKEGWNYCTDPKEAQLIVVNTCGFIQAAKEESIDTILEMAAYKRERPVTLVVSGCLSQRYRAQLAKGLPEVDIFLGSHQFSQLPKILKMWQDDQDNPQRRHIFTQDNPHLYDHLSPRINTLTAHSAYVKVAEGCQHNCAFCIIPAIRGRLRSRSIDSIVQECHNLGKQGIQEINLIAQDLAAYGRDRGSDDLLDLLCELEGVDTLSWIRLLYMYPENIKTDFLEYFAQSRKLVTYLDVPMQHGSSQVLKRMNRGVTRSQLSQTLLQLRNYIPHITIRTSVMVGFPGETEEEFSELYDFVKEHEFDHLGCFTYSQEAGTVAGAMKEQIDEETKRLRQNTIMTLQKDISWRKLSKRMGQKADFLVEKPLHPLDGQSCENNENNVASLPQRFLSPSSPLHTQFYKGRLASQAPEVDGIAYLEVTSPNAFTQSAASLTSGTIIQATITDHTEYDLKLSLP